MREIIDFPLREIREEKVGNTIQQGARTAILTSKYLVRVKKNSNSGGQDMFSQWKEITGGHNEC